MPKRRRIDAPLLEPLNDGPTRAAVLAERAFLRGLGGGCLVPIGAARGVVEGDVLHLRGSVPSPWRTAASR